MTPTIQNVIQTILSTVPGAPLKGTVDTFKTGDPSQEVTGIVTTFLANREVIESAKALGANLIITHEPIFYNHRDRTGWLKKIIMLDMGLTLKVAYFRRVLAMPRTIAVGFAAQYSIMPLLCVPLRHRQRSGRPLAAASGS